MKVTQDIEIEGEVTCPRCGKEFNTTVNGEVTIDVDLEELKENSPYDKMGI